VVGQRTKKGLGNVAVALGRLGGGSRVERRGKKRIKEVTKYVYRGLEGKSVSETQ